MKIIAFIAVLLFALCPYAMAELYHGIDIDDVYATSDWSSKDDIKKIIDDYTLLLQYQEELPLCYENSEKLPCMNNLAKNIIKRFYIGNTDNNLNNYQNYVKATFASYGIIYCLNKYRNPPGTMCSQENTANAWKLVNLYINELLQQTDHLLSNYSFLQNYKK